MIRTTRSNALRWAVEAPRGTVYLTGLQWHLWWTLSRPRRTWRGDVTLTRLSTLTGSSRGRCWHALTRLRSLELVSWRAYPVMELEPARRPRRFSPGRNGRLLVWIPKAAQRARLRAAIGGRRATGNDSVSGAYGTWITREGLAAALARRLELGRRQTVVPSGYGGKRARPWKGPPRVIWSRCPAGHRLKVGRRSWALGPPWAPSVSVLFEADCPRCSAPVTESIRLELALPARPLSPAELLDPAVMAARTDAARLEVDRPGQHPGIRELLRRDYVQRPAETGRESPPSPAELEHAAAVLARIAPARLRRPGGA